MLPRRHCAGERKNGKNKRESGVSSKHFDTRKLPNCEGWTVITEVSLNARALIGTCGLCKQIHECGPRIQRMECQMASSRKLSELRFDLAFDSFLPRLHRRQIPQRSCTSLRVPKTNPVIRPPAFAEKVSVRAEMMCPAPRK